MNSKTKIAFLGLSLIILLLIFPAFFASAETFSYTPLEEIPGFDRPSGMSAYVIAIYKFGLWTIGVSAVFMITIGAFMYITSAGNGGTTTKAKGIIVDAIVGLILALLSYLLLYIINPNLLDNTNASLEQAAKDYTNSSNPTTYGKYPEDSSTLPKACTSETVKNALNSAAAGGDMCELMALAAMESSCNPSVNSTNGGKDCGMMQTRVNSSPSCPYSCAEITGNTSDAISKAATCGKNYIANNYASANQNMKASRSNNQAEQIIRDKYATYNGGPGALNPSVDCAGTNSLGNPYVAYDCPTNCNKACDVPARTSKFLNYYNKCKAL